MTNHELEIRIPRFMRKKEGEVLLAGIQDKALFHLKTSAHEMTTAMAYFHAIREHGLYVYGGYETWGEYIEEIAQQSGFSKTWIWKNLRIMRIALANDVPLQKILELGIDRLRILIEGIVDKYDPYTGKIEEMYLESDDYAQTLGLLVEQIEPDEPKAFIHELVERVAPRRQDIVTLRAVFDDQNRWVDLRWVISHPDGSAEAGGSMKEMPLEVVTYALRELSCWDAAHREGHLPRR